MRTFRITLAASLAGWFAGVVAGSVGGLVLALMESGSETRLRGMSVATVIFSEILWAFIVAAAILPCSVFCVAPLVFRALGRPSCWSPFKAACIGGGIGLAALVLELLVLSLFGSPINWQRKGETLDVAILCIPTALAIGAPVGCVAASMVRSHVRTTPVPTAPAPPAVPPPLPYEY